MSPAVTVVIVNYNAGARLRRVLACLAEQAFRDFDVILFDNASSDGSLEGLAAPAGLRMRIIESPDNLGFAAANNRAAAAATGEWLALLNPDAYPEPGWLAALMDAARRHPGVDAFGSTQVDASDPSRLDGAGDVYFAFGVPYRGGFGRPVEELPPEGECFAPCAAAALYRRETFLALGGFDERFFCYGEDVDFGFRLRLAGGRAVQAREARVLHEGSGLTGRRSDFAMFHGHRNRVWTYVKNMPGALFWLTLPGHLLASLALFAQAAFRGGGGAYARAMVAAAKGLGPAWRARREIQKGRKARLPAMARALTWSPLKLLGRRADIRDLKLPPDTAH